MCDISLPWGGSITVNAQGDIATVDGAAEASQRILRRYLTTSGEGLPDGTQTRAEYIWDKKYGGNARAYVDRNISSALTSTLQYALLEQTRQEASVAPTPDPTIIITKIPKGISMQATVPLRTGGVALIPQTEITN